MRPWITTFSSVGLSETTIKGNAEPFGNLPPIEFLAAPAILQDCPRSRSGIEQSIVKYSSADVAPILRTADREHDFVGQDKEYWPSGLADFLSMTRHAARAGIDLATARYLELVLSGRRAGGEIKALPLGSGTVSFPWG